jgi:hypothetical protein
MRLFQSAAPDQPAPVEAQQQSAAYEQGRQDAKAGVNERTLLQERDTTVRRAYERGRRDERARRPHRRGSPVLTTVLVLAAAAGVFVVYLGVSQGSFGRGGQMVDQNIANATSTAMNAVHRTVDKAGDALQGAGQNLKRTAGSNG